jgi:hypothetical protein
MPTDDRPDDPPRAAEASLDRLRRAGWSVAEYTVRVVSPPAVVRLVVGEAGEARLLAAGPTRDAASSHACAQAEALGMLRRGTTRGK